MLHIQNFDRSGRCYPSGHPTSCLVRIITWLPAGKVTFVAVNTSFPEVRTIALVAVARQGYICYKLIDEDQPLIIQYPNPLNPGKPSIT
ncbi:MAG: hypothetical protein KA821_09045 [Chitinophagaceae bacterium]|nr:hypothetical protein [Chitinophagaceae bacterium]